MTPKEWAEEFWKKRNSMGVRAIADDLFKNPWAQPLTQEQVSHYLKLCRGNAIEAGRYVERVLNSSPTDPVKS